MRARGVHKPENLVYGVYYRAESLLRPAKLPLEECSKRFVVRCKVLRQMLPRGGLDGDLRLRRRAIRLASREPGRGVRFPEMQ